MQKKLSFIVTFAFVFISIAHACSGLTSMNPAMQQRQMHMAADDPCGTKEPDICKSVRDSMLSVKPIDAGADSLAKTLSASALAFASPTVVSFSPIGLASGPRSPSLSNSSLSFSPVLRI